MTAAGATKITNCFVHTLRLSQLKSWALKAVRNPRTCAEGCMNFKDRNWNTFTQSDANVPVVSPVTDVEIMDGVNHRDIDRRASDDESEEPCEALWRGREDTEYCVLALQQGRVQW